MKSSLFQRFLRSGNTTRAAAWVSAVCLAAFTAGCGSGNPKTYPAHGTVMYKNATLQSGMVYITPEGGGTGASGKIQTDGSFKLGTFDADDGALPGKYKVRVEVFPEGEDAGLPGMEFGKKKPPIPMKYMDPSKTPLTCEIKEGDNKIELKLVD